MSRKITWTAVAWTLAMLAGCSSSIPDAVWKSESAHEVERARTGGESPPQSPPDDEVQDKVAQSSAAKAIDQLPRPVAPLNRPYTRWTLKETVDNALVRLGPAALPRLEAELGAGDVQAKRLAAADLARMGPDATARVETVELLVDKLADEEEDEVVRIYCARALGEIGPAIWPIKPSRYRPITTLAAAATPNAIPQAVDETMEDDALASNDPTRPPVEIRLRLEYDETASPQYRRFEAARRDYDRRVAAAQRAVEVLAAMSGLGDSTDLSMAQGESIEDGSRRAPN